MQTAVSDATEDGRVEVSVFIRMEYLRLAVRTLIDFYFLIKESESVADALIDWSRQFQMRRIKIVTMSASKWMCDQDDSRSKEKSLRRLGDGIVRLVYEFDRLLNSRGRDHLRCELGDVFFPRRPFSEDLLLDFRERFDRIRARTPNCDLCAFKEYHRRQLETRNIDLYGPSQRETHKRNNGYVTQAQRLEKLASERDTTAKCTWCERLGDTIISLHTPDNAILVTADRSFEAFGVILGREVRLLPSLAELKSRNNDF